MLINSLRLQKRFSRSRVKIFRRLAPGLSLPPEPILTRWGTWIIACTYYGEDIETVRNVIEQLTDKAECVTKAKEYFSIPGIDDDFHCISEKFQCLVNTITRLETRDLALNETLELVWNTYHQLVTDDDIKDQITTKIARIFERNDGFHQMIDVADCLQRNVFDRLPAGWTTEDGRACCFASLTSVAVERSFSR